MANVILKNENEKILVNENDVYKCVMTNTMDWIIMVKEEDEERALSLINEIQGDFDECEVRDALEGIECIETGGDEAMAEPKVSEYVVVYSQDNNSDVGDDPYFWEYDLYGYTYWDGHNQVEKLFDDIEEVIEVDEKNINNEDYYIVKNKNDEFFLFSENDVDYQPATLVAGNINIIPTDNKTVNKIIINW